jgi:hypothetical protein
LPTESGPRVAMGRNNAHILLFSIAIFKKQQQIADGRDKLDAVYSHLPGN